MKERIRKISDYVWEYPKEGEMNVPALLIMSKSILDSVEEGAIQQLRNVSMLPGIQLHSIGMPDMHYGYGAPVGGVVAFSKEGGVSPGMTGFDINCGVRLLRTGVKYGEIKGKIKDLVDNIFKLVPAGVGKKGILKISRNDFYDLVTEGVDWAIQKGYASERDRLFIEENGRMETDLEGVSMKAIQRGIGQIGTLGAGNHFLEIQVVEKAFSDKAEMMGIREGEVTILIHTGSRGFGHQICSDYVREIYRQHPEIAKSLPDRELVYAPHGSDLFHLYLKSMKAAANFAWVNRQIITHYAREAWRNVIGEGEPEIVYDVAHNIIKEEKYKIDGKTMKLWVHRKGATRAFGPGRDGIPHEYSGIGQPVLIPGSMGTASWVMVGTETASKMTFSSIAHGAGRVLSRRKSVQKYTDKQIREMLAGMGIYARGATKHVLSEEAPQAYKDVDEVIESCVGAGIAEKVARLRPVGVMKG